MLEGVVNYLAGCLAPLASLHVQRALDPSPAFVQHVRVNLSGFHARVPQKLLHCAGCRSLPRSCAWRRSGGRCGNSRAWRPRPPRPAVSPPSATPSPRCGAAARAPSVGPGSDSGPGKRTASTTRVPPRGISWPGRRAGRLARNPPASRVHEALRPAPTDS